MKDTSLYVFAYGSLLWRPGFDYDSSAAACIGGWERRFWQGSPDHRGTPQNPGRVVTLVQRRGARCTGRLYGVTKSAENPVLDYLDHRESGGYRRLWVTAHPADRVPVRALTYVALPGNPHYLGPAPTRQILAHIHQAVGPSGANRDYRDSLFRALGELNINDDEWRTLPVVSADSGHDPV